LERSQRPRVREVGLQPLWQSGPLESGHQPTRAEAHGREELPVYGVPQTFSTETPHVTAREERSSMTLVHSYGCFVWTQSWSQTTFLDKDKLKYSELGLIMGQRLYFYTITFI